MLIQRSRYIFKRVFTHQHTRFETKPAFLQISRNVVDFSRYSFSASRDPHSEFDLLSSLLWLWLIPQDLPRTEYPLLDCLHETDYRTFTLHLQTAAVYSVFYAFRLCQIDTYRVLWCYERLEMRPPGGWPYRCKRVRTVTSVIIACSLSALGVRWCYSRLHGVHLLKIHT